MNITTGSLCHDSFPRSYLSSRTIRMGPNRQRNGNVHLRLRLISRDSSAEQQVCLIYRPAAAHLLCLNLKVRRPEFPCSCP